jgi:hypothetical protein
MKRIDLHDVVWTKSSRSSNGNCVEVARLGDGRIGVRDSKNRDGAVLLFTPRDWRDFIGGLKAGK